MKFSGKLIPFKSIHQIRIISTLLLDDEIELFAIKNKFRWFEQEKNYFAFIDLCQNETNQLLRNPYLLEDGKAKFRNQNFYFVNPQRITELQKIKRRKIDLSELIQLCKELNNASSNNSFYSTTMLVRSIIDHVPPIFGCTNFSEVANNYSKGGRSFKKSMLNLNNSLRNIADNNIHSQAREKEVLPTLTQIDFTPELDLLLSEIIRILKQ